MYSTEELLVQKASMTEVEIPHNVVNGIVFPSFITQQRLDELRDFPLKPDDLFIPPYPKSGTTWLQQIVKLVVSGGKDDGKNLTEAVVWLEELNPSDPNHYYQINVDNLASPRVFKSHTPYSMMPGGPPHTTPARYIYVARNPKDVLVSYYYHCITWKSMLYSGSWDQFYTMFMNNKIPFGSWFDHVLDWWKHRDAKNILFLKYEEMIDNLKGTVETIAKFLEYDLSPDVISSIVTQSTFESMRKNPTANYSWWENRRKPESVPFMRKGKVGDWRNHFSSEQSAEFDAVYAKRMKDTGLDFDFGQE